MLSELSSHFKDLETWRSTKGPALHERANDESGLLDSKS